MEIKYYEVKYKLNEPEAMGIVIKQKENKLEVLSGNETDMKRHGCILDSDFNLKLNEDSIYFEIDEKRAKKICGVYERYAAHKKYLRENNLEELETGY